MNSPKSLLCTTIIALTLSSCGGNGREKTDTWQEGTFPDISFFEDRCEITREENTFDTQGSAYIEKMWLRSWSNSFYLWYDEIIDIDPQEYDTAQYFDLLITNELTVSGAAKDNFHFSVNTEDWISQSQSGISSGYGIEFAIFSSSSTTPLSIYVAYTQPDSPATAPETNILRGSRIISVDGQNVADAFSDEEFSILNNGVFPSNPGETHTFEIQNTDDPEPRTISITSADITSVPVQNVSTIDTDNGKVGYFLFNDHIATAEQGLIDAIETLANENIDDLVLDLRYNGGGYLAIASQLSYMLAGANATQNAIFESIQFNDKYPNTNPITTNPLTPTPFYNQTLGFSTAFGESLPTLDLSRVFVLTSGSTCSASESIMNALLGIDIEVIQIGKTTCGKPYGFYPTDNCGTTYFSIQFQGVNNKGFGEYSDGFTPENSSDLYATSVKGCEVEDDLSHALGDPNEGRLSAALFYRETGQCPSSDALNTSNKRQKTLIPTGSVELIGVPAWKTIRIMDTP